MMKKISFFFITMLFINATQSQVNLTSVKIGNQTWMNKNLDAATYRNGDPIPEVTDAAAWAALTTGAWCHYNNDPANDAVYGKLYNWYAINDSRGLAPAGWHVPGDKEWGILETGLENDKMAGDKMKEAGSTHWKGMYNGSSNSSGFTGLPGGYRTFTGSFIAIGLDCDWWSSTEKSPATAWYRSLNHSTDWIGRDDGYKLNGFSVRCLRD